MSGIRNKDIRCSYAGKGEKILKEFLLPLLDEAVSYDRITSFYTIDSLLAISQGVQKLFERDGKMRLIIGIHSVPPELVSASLRKDYLREQIVQVRDEIIKGVCSLENSLEKKRVATLAWMIEDGLLDVRAAAVSGEGIFHPKTFILKDEEGDTVAAIGSSNETGSGLGGNYEQIVALKSWLSPEDVTEQEKFFESLWTDNGEDVTVCEVNEEVAEAIRAALGDEFPNPKHGSVAPEDADGVINIASQMPANFFVSGAIPALFQHQERAVIDALSRWPVRVLFSDEVGLGKTFEVAATMAFLVKYCGVKRVLILTPKAVLQQWQDELATHFGIDAWLYDSTGKVYLNSTGEQIKIGSKNPIGSSSPDIMLMSAQLARGSSGKSTIFERKGAVLPDLLILDEAHSARVSKDLTGHDKVTRMYKMLEAVTPLIPHVIFATATPMQKDASEYHSMLKLLGLPKTWQNKRHYRTSLDLISSDSIPEVNDAYSAGKMVRSTLRVMKPSLERLSSDELVAVQGLIDLGDESDQYDTAVYVQDNWDAFRRAFVKLHPAHLLTVRNTRRALTEIGYRFPKRNLEEVSISKSTEIQLFYQKVNAYISETCFSVEKELYPDREISVGFVRVSYQQRVASSLYSCRESLSRRLEKLLSLRKAIQNAGSLNDSFLEKLGISMEVDDFSDDEMLEMDLEMVEALTKAESSIDIPALANAVNIECTSLQPLLDELDSLLIKPGDMKVISSVKLAIEHIEKGDKVLLFSRYTDTVDALVVEFRRQGGENSYTYGVYVGQKSVIISGGAERKCDKAEIKSQLQTGDLKLMICSDAASEGLNLQAARVLINVDVPWTPARLEQRIGRIARLGQQADEIDVYNVWYPNSIEARMYRRIQKRLEESNLAIGEFPEVVADGIRNHILTDTEQDDDSAYQLQKIRNSTQTKALNELWSVRDETVTTSRLVREKLMSLCDDNFECVNDTGVAGLKEYRISDNQTVTLTAIEGFDEAVSLGSPVWSVVDYELGDFGYVRDPMGNPATFIQKNDLSSWLDHEFLVDLLSDRPVGLESLTGSYPKMLADPSKMSFEYAVEETVPERPSFWPPKIGGE